MCDTCGCKNNVDPIDEAKIIIKELMAALNEWDQYDEVHAKARAAYDKGAAFISREDPDSDPESTDPLVYAPL